MDEQNQCRDKLLEEVALCVVGLFRDDYMKNIINLKQNPEYCKYGLSQINDTLMDKMCKLIGLIAGLDGGMEMVEVTAAAARGELLESIEQHIRETTELVNKGG